MGNNHATWLGSLGLVLSPAVIVAGRKLEAKKHNGPGGSTVHLPDSAPSSQFNSGIPLAAQILYLNQICFQSGKVGVRV